ncbi:ABC transporter substrate-binding protein [Geminocystis herdmanii]|uniref:ABC transporter substrate-binding protein n=1 Tax=Geminocystis herdmanii TaxID=669359 RepID=UPI00034B329E|nr:ABC transporter substrate-binding protein [Geminocystis herdmanii]
MNISYKRKGFFKSVILIFISGILVITLSNCKTETTFPLRIGSNIWPGYATLYLARDLGDYTNTTIKLVDYPSATEVVRAYRHEEIEGVALTIDEALVLASTQDNIRIVAIFNISDGGDVILGKPEIKTMKDLKGKRVGVESTALGAFFLTRGLEESGMSLEDIKIVSLELSEHEKAYQNDLVDAIVTFYPPKSKILEMGANLLFDSSQIPGEIVDVLVVNTGAIENSPQTIQTLINGHFKGLDYLEKKPQEASPIMAKRSQVTPEEFLESLNGLRQPNLQENQDLLSKNDPSLINAMEKLVTIMLDNKLLTNTVDIESLLDDRFVQNVTLKDNEHTK